MDEERFDRNAVFDETFCTLEDFLALWKVAFLEEDETVSHLPIFKGLRHYELLKNTFPNLILPFEMGIYVLGSNSTTPKFVYLLNDSNKLFGGRCKVQDESRLISASFNDVERNIDFPSSRNFRLREVFRLAEGSYWGLVCKKYNFKRLELTTQSL